MFFYLKKRIKKSLNTRKKKGIILCYHRIADEQVDPWDIAVSPANFEEHLKVLAKEFKTANIPDLINDFDSTCTSNTVCLSFDDGYKDNYYQALPLLKKYKIPSSFFIASAFTGKNEMFWWDELSEIILKAPVLPQILTINIDNTHLNFILDENDNLSEDAIIKIALWKYNKSLPHKRCELFLKLWELIRPLQNHEINNTLSFLRKWAGVNNIQNKNTLKLPMDENELYNLSEDPLFTIGLHTHHHTALGIQSRKLQEEEIRANQIYLKTILKKEPNLISFPYGSYNNQTIEVVRDNKLLACFNSERKIMTKDSDPFSLGRYGVKNWNGKKLNKKLSTWFKTVD